MRDYQLQTADENPRDRASEPKTLKVAVFCPYYLPGFKSGGPVISVSRIVDNEVTHLVRVVTRDREPQAKAPYPDVTRRTWIQVGRAQVAYLPLGIRDWLWLVAQLRAWRPDLYYFNSLQNPTNTLLTLALRRVGILPKCSLLIAPRGECSAGAQSQKTRKKRLARPVIRALIGRRAAWHASSAEEAADIEKWWGSPFPKSHRILVKVDPPPEPAAQVAFPPARGRPQVVFASRIDRMKGLDTLIRAAVSCRTPFELSVFGVVRDEEYWAECLDIARQLPPWIPMQYKGEYRPDEAADILANADVFVLPTHGENFGHAIAEALSVGCLTVISDNTIWTPVVLQGGGSVVKSTDDLSATLDRLLALPQASRESTRLALHRAYKRWFEAAGSDSSLFSTTWLNSP